jgi:hypothetical protein
MQIAVRAPPHEAAELHCAMESDSQLLFGDGSQHITYRWVGQCMISSSCTVMSRMLVELNTGHRVHPVAPCKSQIGRAATCSRAYLSIPLPVRPILPAAAAAAAAAAAVAAAYLVAPPQSS